MRDGAESVRLALVALASSLESLPGRKSVFWITEGFPPDMLQNTYLCACANEWKAAFDKLNDANVAVSALDSNGIAGPPRLCGHGGVLVMQKVSATTGGQTYYQYADLSAALSRGIAGTRSSYTLGFYMPTLDGAYHTLKVAVDRPGVALTYRRGYYDEDDSQRGAASQLERDGLNLKRTLRLAPGVTQIEVVIRDHDSGRIGSLAVPLGAPSPAGK